MSFESFHAAYIEALFWSETDDSTGDDSNYNVADLSIEACADIEQDCRDFYDANVEYFGGERAASAGHDFCLTRNGHGAGFWDGDWWGETGETLTAACKPYGSQGLYRGDDGKLYTHN